MKRNRSWLIPILFVGIFLFLVSIVHAAPAIYYVDFDQGDDANSGLSQASAWKHAPGDPQARGNPAAVQLQPGDTVRFKAGVVYRGNIEIHADGTEENPITYSGQDWGESKAILDGSEVLHGSWTRCPSQQACAGNPHWEQIYSIPAPQGITFFNTLFEDNAFLWYSQDPNPEDPFYYDYYQDYRVIPEGDPDISITRTSITDPRYFTQSDPNIWDGAYVAVWRNPNVVVLRRITGFNPPTHTIFFEDLDGDLYTDRDEYYSIMNHMSIIDRPGEYAYDEDQGRIYLWPLRDGDPSQKEFTYAERRVGLDIDGHSHLIIEGFQFQKYFGDLNEHGMGVAIRNSHTWGESMVDVTIRDNEVTQLRSLEGAGAIGLSNVQAVLIEENHLINNQRNTGILAGGEDIIVRGNDVSRCSRVGIWFMGVNHGQIVGNVVEDIRGTHSNGISVYSGSADVLVANNRVSNSPRPFTFSDSRDVIVINNIFDGGNGGNNADEWGSTSGGTVAFLNNVLVRNNRDMALNIGNGGAERYIVKNNIIDGTCLDPSNSDVSHNIYTGLAWCQDEADFKEGEFREEDLTRIFLAPEQRNFTLYTGSVAVDTGIDISLIVPFDQFPPFDVGLDIDGTIRPQGKGWDVGAYEYTDLTATTFIDVPFEHWAHDYIEVLYQEGYVAGCSAEPLLYCPDQIMTRAESAVFVERGAHGAEYLPIQPSEQIFIDVPLSEWYAKWATALWEDGYTEGCSTDPLMYCPLQQHTRAEGCVFFLRMMNRVDYVPPDPQGIFTDVPLDWWGAKWVEAAYNAGLIPACETDPELMFCPDAPLDRAMGAYMMVQAKGLEIP